MFVRSQKLRSNAMPKAAALPDNPLPKIIEALTTIGNALGLSIIVEDKPKPAAPRADSRRDQHRLDVTWLMRQPGLCGRLRGNYAAIHQKQIIAIGPDEKSVRAGAAEKLGIPRKAVLVVPFQVPGSEDSWAATCASLDIELDMDQLAP